MSVTVWSGCLEAAAAFLQEKPWEKMWDTDWFGLEQPDREGAFFVEVNGRVDENPGVRVFPNEMTLQRYVSLNADETTRALSDIEVPHGRVSFQNERFLNAEDWAILGDARPLFEPFQLYPVFTINHACRTPIAPTDDWAPLFREALGQTIGIKSDYPQKSEERYEQWLTKSTLPVRRQTIGEDGKKAWHTSTIKLKTLDFDPAFQIAPELVEKLVQLDRDDAVVELDFFPVPYFQKADDALGDVLPFSLLMIDQEDHAVLAREMLSPEQGMEQMLIELPNLVAEALIRRGSLPAEMLYGSLQLEPVLSLFTRFSGLMIDRELELPLVKMAQVALFRMLQEPPMPPMA